METWEANRIAVGGHAKALREALRGLGKKVSLRWIYYQCSPPTDVNRPDPFGLFWRWFEALWLAHRPGAEFLFEDFCARVSALRDSEPASGARDWYEELSICAREQSEALQAAIRRHDDAAIRRELAESIAAERRLLVMLNRTASASARREAA